jgi:hypothetical protein
MNVQGRDILIGTLAAIVVGVAAIGIAMGLPGLQPPPQATSEGTDAELRYACSADHASFTIADLLNAPAADAGDDAAAALLRMVIADGFLPVEGWRRVVDGPEEVVFLSEAGIEGAPHAFVHVVPGQVGAPLLDGWAVESYGACTPRPVVPDVVSVADWWVAPDAVPMGPDSDSIPTLVHERACASGQDAEGRIMPPTIVYGQTAVTITIVVQLREGAQDCQGNPLTPYTIELTEPLGDRTLLDGGQLPPGNPLEDPQN